MTMVLFIFILLPPHFPWREAAEWDEMFLLWFLRDVRLEVRELGVQKVQQITHEAVDHVRLVTLTHGVQVDGSILKPQGEPLKYRRYTH